MKAKVFLSCGQSKGSGEPEIAGRVAQKIRDHGFDCYIAVAEQSLLGLRENIFSQLESSDYLVFIDFKRELLQIAGSNVGQHRGSLFSHQELAIASYLQIPALVLQEAGVKQLDGMLNVMQANAEPFSDRGQLPNTVSGLIHNKIISGEWQPASRRQLTLESSGEYADGLQPDQRIVRHFHITVTNHHHRNAALDCFAYLDSITDLASGNEKRIQTIEFKWAGTMLPNVRIGPNSSRKLDAFWINIRDPKSLGFNVFTDSSDYRPILPGSGRYELAYSVVSSNFPPTTARFLLSFDKNFESVAFGSQPPNISIG